MGERKGGENRERGREGKRERKGREKEGKEREGREKKGERGDKERGERKRKNTATINQLKPQNTEEVEKAGSGGGDINKLKPTKIKVMPTYFSIYGHFKSQVVSPTHMFA